MSIYSHYLDSVYSQHWDFASYSNHYCARSKPVECQVLMISLLQSFTSTAKEYRDSTVITPRLQLAHYCASSKYCLASEFPTWDVQ